MRKLAADALLWLRQFVDGSQQTSVITDGNRRRSLV